MRKLLRQIKRELKTAKHWSAASGLTTEISANQKSPDLLRSMAFACAFIVPAYAPFSIKSLPSAAKSDARVFVARISRSLAQRYVAGEGTVDFPTAHWITCGRRCVAARTASNPSQSAVTKLVNH
jgi:hypothetical protein